MALCVGRSVNKCNARHMYGQQVYVSKSVNWVYLHHITDFIYKKKKKSRISWKCCSHQLCSHGCWSLVWTLRPMLCCLWEPQYIVIISGRSNCQAGHLSTFFSFKKKKSFITHARTFRITRTVVVKGARPGSLTVDYKHTQVACMACVHSAGHGGARCQKGVCSTHRVSLSLSLSVSNGCFNPHLAGWCGDNWRRLGVSTRKKKLQLRGKEGRKEARSL